MLPLSRFGLNHESPTIHSVFQSDKAFNASKEELEFIDNNEETAKAPSKDAHIESEPEPENGYLTVLKNKPFVLVMIANLPAVMGLYIPYMYLPGVSRAGWNDAVVLRCHHQRA
jgi:hypothetical protein